MSEPAMQIYTLQTLCMYETIIALTIKRLCKLIFHVVLEKRNSTKIVLQLTATKFEKN